MRAIVVMFDSLNRNYLPPYGAPPGVQAPNFTRLASKSVTFENCYAGSMPCMPARRELHTGRYNFLHRSWGPLEPFDDSVPEMLRGAGVATHLATDHMHYWEDGGATYHNRYGTFSLIRGQQGDPLKGQIRDPEVGPDLRVRRSGTWRQDQVNRAYMSGLADHPQTLTFDAGLEFIATNRSESNWMVQIETFDPHEPFFSAAQFEALHPTDYEGPAYDWPEYMQVVEDDESADHVRFRYSALVSMCDHSLGRVLDAMDRYELWDNTLLIVCTDHGFLLGEQGWWGKSVPPWYDATIHTPLFVWDPREQIQGERRDSLVQTIDIAPTLLDFFDLQSTTDMQGRPLRETIRSDARIREFGLFGGFGGHVSVTDGRFVYMRSSADRSNEPLYEHTLMPTHMRGMFSTAELATAELASPFTFTKGVPVLRTRGQASTNPFVFGTMLFDLVNDPQQARPLVDELQELRMVRALVEAMIASDAPPDQFHRLGIPLNVEAVSRDHLLCNKQRDRVRASREPSPAAASFRGGKYSVHTDLHTLLDHPPAREVLLRHTGPLRVASFGDISGEVSLYRAAALAIGVIPWPTLRAIAQELALLDTDV